MLSFNRFAPSHFAMLAVADTAGGATDTIETNTSARGVSLPAVKRAAKPAKKTAKTDGATKSGKSGKSAVAVIPPLQTRGSSVAEYYEKVMSLFNSANGNTVSIVAASLKIQERQVRSIIDRARSQHGYEAVSRLSPGRFKWNGVPRAAKGK